MKRLFCLLLAFSMLLGVCACDGASGETYTITFDTDGGSTVNPIAKAAGSDLAAPVAPTRDGYAFEGWYKDKACTEIFAFGTMPAENLTLYAKWRYVGESTPGGSTSGGGTPSDDTSGGNTPGGNTPGGGTPSGSVTDGGDRGADGSWENVDFKGQTVKVCVSVNKYDECMFPAADIYTKGPDNAGTNDVCKEVLARNNRASEELGIEIVYQTTDLGYNEILDDIQKIVMTGAKNSPDVYNNDIYGLVRAMTGGYLWNVKNPGDNVTNYFDFTADGWYTEYIKGCTYDQEKLYIFAGDYFIDMIRMAWVVYVNNDILAANISSFVDVKSVDDFYDFVDAGYWDLDTAADMSAAVFVDTNKDGKAQEEDERVGLVINSVTSWITSAASQVTLFYQDKDDGYKPKMMQTTDDYQRVANKYVSMMNSRGVYYATSKGGASSVLHGTQCFLNGNVLFAYSHLGEMESEALRSFNGSKGLVPIPKWSQREQDDYHTPVHDRAELGCILNTAQNFAAASALMQFLNEESEKVVYAYYEKGLKFKYNDDKNTRTMMDIVRDTTDSPFSWQVGWACLDLYTGTPVLRKLYLQNSDTISSTFAAEKGAYEDCLKQMLERFASLD